MADGRQTETRQKTYRRQITWLFRGDTTTLLFKEKRDEFIRVTTGNVKDNQYDSNDTENQADQNSW